MLTCCFVSLSTRNTRDCPVLCRIPETLLLFIVVWCDDSNGTVVMAHIDMEREKEIEGEYKMYDFNI